LPRRFLLDTSQLSLFLQEKGSKRKGQKKALQLESFAVNPSNVSARAKFQISVRYEKHGA
jgi:hypothetical protein